MKRILLDLYCGNYSAIGKPFPKDSAYAKALRAVCDLEDEISESLSADQEETFKRYLDAQAELNDEGCRMYFVEGCIVGAQFMLDVLSEARNE